MTVAELQDLLARLPGDMLVHVNTWDGGAHHITVVDKRPRQRAERIAFVDDEPCPRLWRGKQSVLIPGDGSYVIPSSVVLRGINAVWFGDEPDYEIKGRWPRPRSLAETIREETGRG